MIIQELGVKRMSLSEVPVNETIQVFHNIDVEEESFIQLAWGYVKKLKNKETWMSRMLCASFSDMEFLNLKTRKSIVERDDKTQNFYTKTRESSIKNALDFYFEAAEPSELIVHTFSDYRSAVRYMNDNNLPFLLCTIPKSMFWFYSTQLKK